EAQAAALAVGDIEPAGDGVIDLFAGRHPYAGDKTLARQHAMFGCSERVGRVAALVFQKMSQILIAGDAEQRAATAEAGSELEIGQTGAALGVEPVLLLGQVVVADAGAMQRPQRL